MPSTIITADVIDGLATLADNSVHVVVTSPPYWGLRNYGTEGQLGLEPTPEAYLEKMTAVFREVRRVLRKDGVCFLNIGDSYAGGGGYSPNSPSNQIGSIQSNSKGSIVGSIKPKGNLKPKDLCMMPARLALALQADGWWIRSDIVWSKPNPMPESVTDRPTKSHEYVFMLTKSARYYYDIEATREKFADDRLGNPGGGGNYAKNCPYPNSTPNQQSGLQKGEWNIDGMASGRNARTVWTIATYAYPDAHFATYPPKLVERCLLAALPKQGVCPACGRGWERVVESEIQGTKRNENGAYASSNGSDGTCSYLSRTDTHGTRVSTTIGFRQACTCEPAETIPATVLDPFSGSGTTGVVALQMGANYIGIELNPEYAEMSRRRIERESGGLFD